MCCSIRIGRMLVYGYFRPTADGWPWLHDGGELAASHVKQGIFPCFKIPVCSCGPGTGYPRYNIVFFFKKYDNYTRNNYTRVPGSKLRRRSNTAHPRLCRFKFIARGI